MDELLELEPRFVADEAPDPDIEFEQTSAGGRCGLTFHTATLNGC